MTCGSCVASVTTALKRVPGVKEVEVDLGRGIALVRGDHTALQVRELVAALGAAGYEAGASTGAPAALEPPARGCGAQAGVATKGRCGCCCT
jgi:copper chaperone